MATVTISERLRTAIIEEALRPLVQKMAEEKKKVLNNSELLNLTSLARGATDAAIDAAWALHAQDPRFTQKYNANTRLQLRGEVFEVECTDWPSTLKPWETYSINFDDEKKTHTAQELQVRDLLEELLADFKLAKQDYTTLENTLKTVLTSVPTLKRALEVMPAIENWVPAEYLARHRDNSKREKTATPTAEELKAEALTPEALAALARVRMTQP